MQREIRVSFSYYYKLDVYFLTGASIRDFLPDGLCRVRAWEIHTSAVAVRGYVQFFFAYCFVRISTDAAMLHHTIYYVIDHNYPFLIVFIISKAFQYLLSRFYRHLIVRITIVYPVWMFKGNNLRMDYVSYMKQFFIVYIPSCHLYQHLHMCLICHGTFLRNPVYLTTRKCTLFYVS